MSRDRRILKELKDIELDHDSSGVNAAPVSEETMTHLKGTFPAPPDTPYSGGTYTIDIQIPDQYPFKAPLMKFDTKIWHPNVSSQTVSCWMEWRDDRKLPVVG
jgi:ubiquitin-conjugating enzyme (huntingtin interacting protein 2)